MYNNIRKINRETERRQIIMTNCYDFSSSSPSSKLLWRWRIYRRKSFILHERIVRSGAGAAMLKSFIVVR